MKSIKIVGILNITADSFSDGGLFLDRSTAVEKAKMLVAQGADLIDIGAESSRPEAQKVSSQEELDRLGPVIKTLKQEKIAVSVDTYKPEVMRRVLDMGVDMINDITALKNPASVEIIKQYSVPVVIMHSRGPGPHADRTIREYRNLMDEILRFFEERIELLIRSGIRLENLIIDPGMGFFLGGNPEPSLMVLKHVRELKRFGTPIYLSTSRKSFIGTVLHRELTKRAAGTLATEIWAYLQGVDYLRTHEVEPLRDAIRMLQAIQDVG